MILQSAWQTSFDFLGSKPIVVEPVEEHLTSDAGLLPIRQFDEQIWLTAEFAGALRDPRFGPFVDHTFSEMVRVRIYGILAGYADQNDHDQLRYDPVFKLLAGREPLDKALASQPTLSRFENSINIASLWRLRDVLIDQFLASFAAPPHRLTFDIDPFDDPTHGQQQLTFYHGYYEQYQYLPRLITCAQNDLVVMACLLHGTAHGALGADDEVEYVVGRLRAKWPDVVIERAAIRGWECPRCTTSASGWRCSIPLGYGSIPCSNARATPCWPKRSSNTNERASRSGCSQRLSIRLGRGHFHGGSSSRLKPTPRVRIAGRWSPIVLPHAYCRRRPTTSTPIGVKVRTAIRRSSADWRPIV